MLSSTDQHEPVRQGVTAMSAWARRLLFLRIILIAVLLVGILFWLSSKVIVVLLILLVAALLAYAVVPVIDRLHRFMPRVLAMVLVYLVAIVLFGFLAYITVKTLIPQLNSFAQSVQTFVTPGSNGQESPLDQTLTSLGFTQSQINSATKQIQSQLSSSASAIAKGTEQFIGGLISAGFNILITVVVSVYLLVDGYRFGNWLIGSSPLSQRGWVSTVLEILQRVVGGYIRGQIIMSTCMGVMQFVGMTILGVPYAALIGVLAFVLEFIPDIGTIITGFVAVVIALTVSWQLALITLIYTIIVDCIEGYVLSPRIIGRGVGDQAGGITAGDDCRVRVVWHLGCYSGRSYDGSDPGIGRRLLADVLKRRMPRSSRWRRLSKRPTRKKSRHCPRSMNLLWMGHDLE